MCVCIPLHLCLSETLYPWLKVGVVHCTTTTTTTFVPNDWPQAEDRSHRIGQTRPVTVYRLVTKDSVDWGIYQQAQHKTQCVARHFPACIAYVSAPQLLLHTDWMRRCWTGSLLGARLPKRRGPLRRSAWGRCCTKCSRGERKPHPKRLHPEKHRSEISPLGTYLPLVFFLLGVLRFASAVRMWRSKYRSKYALGTFCSLQQLVVVCYQQYTKTQHSIRRLQPLAGHHPAPPGASPGCGHHTRCPRGCRSAKTWQA